MPSDLDLVLGSMSQNKSSDLDAVLGVMGQGSKKQPAKRSITPLSPRAKSEIAAWRVQNPEGTVEQLLQDVKKVHPGWNPDSTKAAWDEIASKKFVELEVKDPNCKLGLLGASRYRRRDEQEPGKDLPVLERINAKPSYVLKEKNRVAPVAKYGKELVDSAAHLAAGVVSPLTRAAVTLADPQIVRQARSQMKPGSVLDVLTQPVTVEGLKEELPAMAKRTTSALATIPGLAMSPGAIPETEWTQNLGPEWAEALRTGRIPDIAGDILMAAGALHGAKSLGNRLSKRRVSPAALDPEYIPEAAMPEVRRETAAPAKPERVSTPEAVETPVSGAPKGKTYYRSQAKKLGYKAEEIKAIEPDVLTQLVEREISPSRVEIHADGSVSVKGKKGGVVDVKPREVPEVATAETSKQTDLSAKQKAPSLKETRERMQRQIDESEGKQANVNEFGELKPVEINDKSPDTPSVTENVKVADVEPAKTEPKPVTPEVKETALVETPKVAAVKSSGSSGTLKDAGTATMPRSSTLSKAKESAPVKASSIVKDLDKAFAPIRTGRFRQKASGIYKIKENVIRSGKANNLSAISHEVGHHLHKFLWGDGTAKGLSEKGIPKQYRSEISLLAYPGAKSTVIEGFAEFTRLYLTDPAVAKQRAPKFYEHFEARIKEHPDVLKVLTKAQSDIARWIDQPEHMRVKSTISRGEPDAKRPVSADRLYSQWVDELRGLQVAEKEITGGKKVAASKSPFMEAWRGRGTSGVAEEWLNHGITDKSGKVTGKSLKDILSPVSTELDDFTAYAVSRHGMDVIKSKGKDAMPLEYSDYQAVVERAPEHYQNVLDELVEYQDRLLDQLVDSGLISRESKKAMRDKWPNHVPLYRVMDSTAKGGVGKGMANKQSPIRRLKGSGRDIIDPIEGIVKDTYTILSVAQRNRVMTKLVDLAGEFENTGRVVEYVPPKIKGTQTTLGEVLKIPETDPTWADLFDLTGLEPDMAATIFRPSYMPEGKSNIVRVFKDGKPKMYELDPELHASVTTMDTLSTDILTRLLAAPASLLRAGATLTPEFAIRNPMRDMTTALIQSNYGLKPWDIPRAMFHVLGRSDLYHQWKASGGAHASLQSFDRNYLQSSIREMTRQTPKEKVIDFVTHPIEALRKFGEFTEETTRVAEFGKGTKWGKELDIDAIMEAAISSRDVTIDFSRAGSIGKKVNRFTAFFNATVGGMDKMARTFKDHPGRSTARAVSYITAPTIALYLLNRNDKRYQERPEWEKDAFWFIPTPGDGPLIRIPKPFELGIVFGALPERILRYIDKTDPKAFDKFRDSVIDSANPGMIPTILIPWMQVISNKSFSGTPIVPEREKRLPKPLQYGPNTSGTAKFAGEKLDKSPRQIDTLIQGYAGGLGRYGAQGLGTLLEAFGLVDTPPKAEKALSERPVIRGLLANEWTSPVQVNRMYEELWKLEEKAKRFEGGIGKDLTGPEKERLAVLKGKAKVLSGQRKVARAIEKAETLKDLRELLTAEQIPLTEGNFGRQKRDALMYLKRQERSIAESDE